MNFLCLVRQNINKWASFALISSFKDADFARTQNWIVSRAFSVRNLSKFSSHDSGSDKKRAFIISFSCWSCTECKFLCSENSVRYPWFLLKQVLILRICIGSCYVMQFLTTILLNIIQSRTTAVSWIRNIQTLYNLWASSGSRILPQEATSTGRHFNISDFWSTIFHTESL